MPGTGGAEPRRKSSRQAVPVPSADPPAAPAAVSAGGHGTAPLPSPAAAAVPAPHEAPRQHVSIPAASGAGRASLDRGQKGSLLAGATLGNAFLL